LELRRQEDIKKRDEIGQEIATQQAVYRDIKLNIEQALQVLAELKKENKTLAQKEEPNQASGQQKKQAPKEGKRDEDAEVDIDALMEDIREAISEIYIICCDPTGMDAKPTINILQDIELKLNVYMREIQYIHDHPEHGEAFSKKVVAQVTRRRNVWFDANQRKLSAERRNKNLELAERMRNKRTKFRKKFGKPSTSRSEKPRLKKKEVKKVIDEDTLDQLTYLGLDLKAIPDHALSSDDNQ
jgi:hypothetical protein